MQLSSLSREMEEVGRANPFTESHRHQTTSELPPSQSLSRSENFDFSQRSLKDLIFKPIGCGITGLCFATLAAPGWQRHTLAPQPVTIPDMGRGLSRESTGLGDCGHPTSLHLNVLICKMEIMIPPASQADSEDFTNE